MHSDPDLSNVLKQAVLDELISDEVRSYVTYMYSTA